MNKLTHPAACMRVLFYVSLPYMTFHTASPGSVITRAIVGARLLAKQVAQLRYDLIISASKPHREPHCIPRKPRPLPL
jgi:hypothetical protein